LVKPLADPPHFHPPSPSSSYHHIAITLHGIPLADTRQIRLLLKLPLVAAVRPGPEAGAGREREALSGLAAAGLLRGMDVSGTPDTLDALSSRARLQPGP